MKSTPGCGQLCFPVVSTRLRRSLFEGAEKGGQVWGRPWTEIAVHALRHMTKRRSAAYRCLSQHVIGGDAAAVAEHGGEVRSQHHRVRFIQHLLDGHARHIDRWRHRVFKNEMLTPMQLAVMPGEAFGVLDDRFKLPGLTGHHVKE